MIDHIGIAAALLAVQANLEHGSDLTEGLPSEHPVSRLLTEEYPWLAAVIGVRQWLQAMKTVHGVQLDAALAAGRLSEGAPMQADEIDHHLQSSRFRILKRVTLGGRPVDLHASLWSAIGEIQCHALPAHLEHESPRAAVRFLEIATVLVRGLSPL